MNSLNFITENWQFLSVLFVGTGGGGWIGWLLSNKSRKIDLQTKVLKMNAEMIDAVKQDFEDRVSYLQSYIKDLDEINKGLDGLIKQQQEVIKKQKKYLAIYKKRYGILD